MLTSYEVYISACDNFCKANIYLFQNCVYMLIIDRLWMASIYQDRSLFYSFSCVFTMV